MIFRRILVLAVCLSLGGPAFAQSRPQADLILTDGRIITVDPRFSIVDTVVIKDGLIWAVGGPELTEEYQADARIDLGGRSAVPGFNDTHLHIFPLTTRTVMLDKATSVEEVQKLVAAKAKELGKGEWILGKKWDENKFAVKRMPLRGDIDAVAPDNPVVLFRDGAHSVAVNSLALRIAGITRDSPDTDKHVIERDANGEPNGIVREDPGLFTRYIPGDTPAQMRAATIVELKKLFEVGITSAVLANANLGTAGGERHLSSMPDWTDLLDIYGELGDELPRLTVQLWHPGPEALAAFPYRTGYGNDRLKLGAIGEGPGVDGGFTGPAACTKHDYKNQPGYRGRCLIPDAEFQALADSAAKHGWQMGLHMIGDAAIEQSMRVYANALEKYPQEDSRWFASHFGLLPDEKTLELIEQHGFLVAQQPNFIFSLSERYKEGLDADALATLNPIATLQKRGIRVSLGGDTMPTDPILGLWSAVTRKGRAGDVLGPGEGVPIQDAIRMYTAESAYLSWDEKKKGTIEPGRFADIVVLDRDPLTIPSDDLRNMKVDITIVGGKVVYQRPESAAN